MHCGKFPDISAQGGDVHYVKCHSTKLVPLEENIIRALAQAMSMGERDGTRGKEQLDYVSGGGRSKLLTCKMHGTDHCSGCGILAEADAFSEGLLELGFAWLASPAMNSRSWRNSQPKDASSQL
jgi:hypothetical protein